MDTQIEVAGDIELGDSGDGFLARYVPRTHGPLTTCDATTTTAWIGERVLRPSPAVDDAVRLDLHTRVREWVRALLDTAHDDWALISFFGVATYPSRNIIPLLVIALRHDARRRPARAEEIVLRTLDIANALGLVDLAIEVIEGDVMPLANLDQQRSAIIHQQSAAAISHDVFPKQPQLGCHDEIVSPRIHVLSPAPRIRDEALQKIESLITLTNGPSNPTPADGPHPLDNSKPSHPLLSNAQRHDCTIGEVFLTSGLDRDPQLSLHQTLWLDWALISVHPARTAACRGVLSNVTISHCPALAKSIQEPSFSTKRFVIKNGHKFRQLTPGKMVYKAGAQTNTTCGIITGELADLRRKVKLPGGEHVVVHHKEHVIVDDDVPFSNFGDSGASVRARDGTILGMIWGIMRQVDWQKGYPRNGFRPPLPMRGITFMTPMETLLEDMKTAIGKTMPGVEFTLQVLPHN